MTLSPFTKCSSMDGEKSACITAWVICRPMGNCMLNTVLPKASSVTQFTRARARPMSSTGILKFNIWWRKYIWIIFCWSREFIPWLEYLCRASCVQKQLTSMFCAWALIHARMVNFNKNNVFYQSPRWLDVVNDTILWKVRLHRSLAVTC